MNAEMEVEHAIQGLDLIEQQLDALIQAGVATSLERIWFETIAPQISILKNARHFMPVDEGRTYDLELFLAREINRGARA